MDEPDDQDMLEMFRARREGRFLPYPIEETQEWLDSGLTGEQIIAKLEAKFIETEELEELFGDKET